MSQVFKILILMHISSNIMSINNEVGNIFVEKGGLQSLIAILDERLADNKTNWKVLERLIQTFFVFCFKDKNLKTLKQDNVIKRLVDGLIKGSENRQIDIVIQMIKVLTFFTDDETNWSQIICREVVKACI